MRVLVVSAPFLEHTFPLVPLAWELRAAGHDVLLCTAGEAMRVADAGLPAADVARRFDLRRTRRRMLVRNPMLARAERTGVISPRVVATLFGEINDELADGTVSLADEWAPDLVVYGALAPLGALVAARRRVPAVLVDHTVLDRQRLSFAATGHLSYVCGRHGVDTPATPSAAIRMAPAGLVGRRPGWQMRYVPYDEGQLRPAWAKRPTDRPRILVTRSSPADPGDALMRAALRSAGRVDAELVLLRPALDPGRRLPGNVRVAEWTSLGWLLPTCAGVVHHGGAATMLAALAAGVPQLIIPDAGDRHHHARLVRDRGLGLAARRVTPALLERLIGSEELSLTATRARAEIARAPGPEEIAARLPDLVEQSTPPRVLRQRRPAEGTSRSGRSRAA